VAVFLLSRLLVQGKGAGKPVVGVLPGLAVRAGCKLSFASRSQGGPVLVTPACLHLPALARASGPG
jgi:hypothetical protein